MWTNMTVYDNFQALRSGNVLTLRIFERGFLDPLYDTDPVAEAQLFDTWDQSWSDVKSKLDKCLTDQILNKLLHQFDDPEATMPIEVTAYNGDDTKS